MQGYWRPSVTSADVYPCSYGAAACRGGNGSNYCVAGYTEPLCASCDRGYFLSWSEKLCEACGDTSSHVASLVVIGLIFLFFAIIIVVLVLNRVYEHAALQRAGRFFKRLYSKAGVKIYILFVTAQVVKVVLSV